MRLMRRMMMMTTRKYQENRNSQKRFHTLIAPIKGLQGAISGIRQKATTSTTPVFKTVRPNAPRKEGETSPFCLDQDFFNASSNGIMDHEFYFIAFRTRINKICSRTNRHSKTRSKVPTMRRSNFFVEFAWKPENNGRKVALIKGMPGYILPEKRRVDAIDLVPGHRR